MNIRVQYDKIGQKYIDGQKQFFALKKDKAREFIRKNLGNLKNKKVLDIGCGGGTDILFYEKLKADVYGIDPSRFMANMAKRTAKYPERIKVASAEKIPFNKNFFDVVVGRFSFHYLLNLDRAYKEIFRVLKSNGLLVVVVNHPIDDLLRQKNKVYGKQEILAANLYKNKVKIQFPSHILSDYFSKTFLELFDLNSLYESEDTGDKKVHNLKKIVAPSMLGFKAVKR